MQLFLAEDDLLRQELKQSHHCGEDRSGWKRVPTDDEGLIRKTPLINKVDTDSVRASRNNERPSTKRTTSPARDVMVACRVGATK